MNTPNLGQTQTLFQQPQQMGLGMTTTQQPLLGQQPTPLAFPQNNLLQNTNPMQLNTTNPMQLNTTNPMQLNTALTGQNLNPIITQSLQMPQQPATQQQQPQTTKPQPRALRKTLTKADQLSQMGISSQYLKNRIDRKFRTRFKIKMNYTSLQNEIEQRVGALLNKFGIGTRNIDYQSEHMSRLEEIIKQDEIKNEVYFNSALSIEHLNLCTNAEFAAKRDFVLSNQIYFANLTQHPLKRASINQALKKIHPLHQNKRFSKVKALSAQGLRVSLKGDVAKDLSSDPKLFRLYGSLKEYNKGLSENKFESTCITTIFKTLNDSSSIFNKDFKILENQFLGVSSTKGLRQKIVQNTIHMLEYNMKQEIGIMDFNNLNRIFKVNYMPKFRIKTDTYLQQIYPSGVVFLLIRCGEKDVSNKVNDYQKTCPPDQRLYLNQYKRKLKQIQDIMNNPSEYDEQYVRFNIDDNDELLIQCCLLVMGINTIYPCFEERRIERDPDLQLWINLKVSTVIEGPLDSSMQIETAAYQTLEDVQSYFPNGVGLYLDLYLQRYDQAVKFLQRQPTLMSEYIILKILIKNLGLSQVQEQQTIFSKGNYNEEDQRVEQIIISIFSLNPLLSILLMQLSQTEYDKGDIKVPNITEFVIQQLASTQKVRLVLDDKKFLKDLKCILHKDYDNNFENFIRCGTTKATLIFNAAKMFNDFLEEMSNIRRDSNNYWDQFKAIYKNIHDQVEEMAKLLKLLSYKNDSIEEIDRLIIDGYLDLSYLLFFCQGIINVFLFVKFQLNKKMEGFDYPKELEEISNKVQFLISNSDEVQLLYLIRKYQNRQVPQFDLRILKDQIRHRHPHVLVMYYWRAQNLHPVLDMLGLTDTYFLGEPLYTDPIKQYLREYQEFH